MRAPLNLLLRDLVIVAVTVLLWQVSHRLQLGDHALSWPLAGLSGLLIAVCGYLVHEWGHALAALASGAQIHWPPSVAAVFLFKFDCGRSTRRQFLWMSAGGFIASGLVLALLAAVLSRSFHADVVAAVLSVLGVIATIILEVPAAWAVWRGAPLPRGVAFVNDASAAPGR